VRIGAFTGRLTGSRQARPAGRARSGVGSPGLDKLNQRDGRDQRSAHRVSTSSTSGTGAIRGRLAGSRQARPAGRARSQVGPRGLDKLDQRDGSVHRSAHRVSTSSTSGTGAIRDRLTESRQARPTGRERSQGDSSGLDKLDQRDGRVQRSAHRVSTSSTSEIEPPATGHRIDRRVRTTPRGARRVRTLTSHSSRRVQAW